MPKSSKRREPGRPLKLDDAVRDRLVRALRQGQPYIVAADVAGIGRSTFHRYMAQGELDAEANRDTPFREFRDAVQKAESEAQVVLVSRIQAAATAGNWQAAAWMLERRHPDEWGRRDRVDHAGVPGAPIELKSHDVSKLSTDELRVLYLLQRKMQPPEANQ